MGKLTIIKGDFSFGSGLESVCKWRGACGVGGWGWGPSSGRRGYLHAQQVIRKDVPEDGEEEEGDEGEDDDPPGALFLETLLVAAQNQQPHADTDHGSRQVRHEAGLGPRGGQRRREAEPDCTTHLRTHCGGQRKRQDQRGGIAASTCS